MPFNLGLYREAMGYSLNAFKKMLEGKTGSVLIVVVEDTND